MKSAKVIPPLEFMDKMGDWLDARLRSSEIAKNAWHYFEQSRYFKQDASQPSEVDLDVLAGETMEKIAPHWMDEMKTEGKDIIHSALLLAAQNGGGK